MKHICAFVDVRRRLRCVIVVLRRDPPDPLQFQARNGMAPAAPLRLVLKSASAGARGERAVHRGSRQSRRWVRLVCADKRRRPEASRTPTSAGSWRSTSSSCLGRRSYTAATTAKQGFTETRSQHPEASRSRARRVDPTGKIRRTSPKSARGGDDL